MPYEVIFTKEAEKFLNKSDKSIKGRILGRLERLQNDPQLGKPLTANLSGLWSLRVGNYRAIYQIKDNELIVVIITIGHRKNVYD